jgi:hypothetical protein
MGSHNDDTSAPVEPPESALDSKTGQADQGGAAIPEGPTPSSTPADGNPASESTGDASATARPKRKKKKRSAPDPEAPARAELDVTGRERPAFLLNFPADPELELLIAAFEAGNYRAVRERAPRLAERTERAEVKAAALELARRIEPDPLVKFLLAVGILLFVAVVAYVYHSHAG